MEQGCTSDILANCDTWGAQAGQGTWTAGKWSLLIHLKEVVKKQAYFLIFLVGGWISNRRFEVSQFLCYQFQTLIDLQRVVSMT